LVLIQNGDGARTVAFVPYGILRSEGSSATSMSDFEAALKSYEKHISPVLLELEWQRKKNLEHRGSVPSVLGASFGFGLAKFFTPQP